MMDRLEAIRGKIPSGGLFHEKAWRLGPTAYPFSEKEIQELEQLGQVLLVFQRACNLLYRQSFRGKAPSWVAELLDRGKPEELVELGRRKSWSQELPKVIRPDLILTESGWALSEIDSLPGGIGLTAWLGETYGSLGDEIVGGTRGMEEGFRGIFPKGDVVIAEEASDYWPEWEWLVGRERVKEAESYRYGDSPVYRFFEGFDWSGLSELRNSWHEDVEMTPPLKAYMEEKIWLALLWTRPLEEFWRRELGAKYWKVMRATVPEGWVLDPTPLPPHAVLLGLDVNDWRDVGDFSQKERELILKVSGFSPLAWGSRGVVLGSDVSSADWRRSIDDALKSFDKNPYILQRFRKGKSVPQLYWNENDELVEMQARMRLCPFYFVEEDRAVLKGGLVTLCPADKKILHGMSEAVLLPMGRA